MATTITAAYDRTRKSLDTGDIVLFSGKGPISQGIKRFTFSKWSHVGMVIKSHEFDSILLWESTTLTDIPDLESGNLLKGVQIVPLSQRIALYNGGISIRKLTIGRTKKRIASLVKLRKELRGKKYEKSNLELIRSAYDGPFGHNTEDLSSLFCSELVAEAYQAMGLLPDDKKSEDYKPSNEYTPADFSYKKRKYFHLLKGRLGKEIVIKAKE